MENSIRVIIFEDDSHWVAQCLEYGIAAQATDLEELHSRIVATVEAEARAGMEFHGEPFKGIDPAPRHFHEMWERKSITFRDKWSTAGEHPRSLDPFIAV